MKQLTIKLVIPLTVISFLTFTKWWYILPVDAPDTMCSGFPLLSVCDGWHTSGSLQFFMTECAVNFLTFFLFWFATIYCVDRFLTKIKTYKILTIVLYILTGLLLVLTTFIVTLPENVFKFKRNFDMEVVVTGNKFNWQNTERPDYYKYYPEDKQK
jgi:hypothetical protein